MSNGLPQGWQISCLEEMTSAIGGGTPPKSEPRYWIGGTIPWVSPKDMKTHLIADSEDHVTELALNRLSVVPAESVLVVVRSGILSRTLPVARTTVPVTVNQDMRAFTPASGISGPFVAWQLIGKEREILDKCSKDGTTVASIEGPTLAHFPLVVAPTAEQVRIVAKLEELLSDLDAGVAELKVAQKKLQQYRQSLLKSAVEGALTASWREVQRQHGTPIETGAQLLQRILAERRARWEAKQLAKFQEQGKAPPKDWQKKYPEPVQPDTTDLPKLPRGWAWASLDMLGEIQGGIQKQPARTPVKNKFPFLRVANVARGELRLDEIHEIELFSGEFERLALQAGDVLIVEGNGSLTEIGRCAIWDGSIPNAVHQNHLIRVRPIMLVGQWLERWLNSPRGISKMTDLAATTSGLYTLSVGKIARLPVPVAPAQEQQVMLETLDVALQGQVQQLHSIEISVKQATAQRQNVLRYAFAGELVPQDPNDEPASALLERIRTERAERAKQPKARRIKQRKEIASVVKKLIDVLEEAGDWVTAQEAFRRCGVADGALTERIEELYVELRGMDKAGRLAVEAVTDAQGRKLHDKLKLLAG